MQVDRHATHEAVRQAAVVMAALRERTVILLRENEAIRIAASQSRIASAATRAQIARRRLSRVDDAWFVVRGLVDGTPATARWTPTSFDCDREIERRVDVIVAMGDTFTNDAVPDFEAIASLDGPPLVALLTVMRAFSLVTSVEVSASLIEAS
jgi:hypothetical protein